MLPPTCRCAAGECLEAVSGELDFFCLPNCFELFGFDLLVDEDWHVWLLEVRISAQQSVHHHDHCFYNISVEHRGPELFELLMPCSTGCSGSCWVAHSIRCRKEAVSIL